MSASARDDDTADPSATAAPGVSAPAAGPHRASERYDMLGEHGRGGLGRVSRAHDRELDRDVAIKELLHRTHVSEVRFFREALITARLEHPNIVPVHEAGRWPDGTPFYAMKLVAGRPLRDLIAERHTVAQRLELLHHVIAVADAIAYAHGRNIIHRDLKPANIIVGDFGETIVIDWGLAKDLSTSDEPSQFLISPSPPATDLTSTGSVLGTPTYMAPEQARGDRVDQRADVFAIGAMLWELCSLQKVPPIDRATRHRILHRSNIDRDLITILDKALQSERKLRYPDAAALAADLKAFKAGTRIAARDYTLLEMASHWARHHRPFTFSLVVLLAVAMAGTTIYIRDISLERQRTNVALQHLESTKRDLDKEHSDLLLNHTELLLTRDPAEALASLANYQGSDKLRASLLRSEALGRGASTYRSAPHSDNVVWASGLSNDDIITMSIDGTISRSTRSGSFEVLRRDAPSWPVFDYSAKRDLLVYACNTNHICAMNIASNAFNKFLAPGEYDRILGIALSPSGAIMAVVADNKTLHLFDIKDIAAPKPLTLARLPTATSALFTSYEEVAVGYNDDLSIVSARSGRVEWKTHITHSSLWVADPVRHVLAVATTQGQIHLFDTTKRIQLHSIRACDGSVTGLTLSTQTGLFVYACKTGIVGTIAQNDNDPMIRARLETQVDALESSSRGDYALAATSNGNLVFIDFAQQTLTTYRGSHSRITSITSPTDRFPFIITGEARGEVRVWPLPDRAAKVIASAGTRIFGMALLERAQTALISTYNSSLSAVGAEGRELLEPHYPAAMNLVASHDGLLLVAYGVLDTIEIWTFGQETKRYSIHSHLKSISAVRFIGRSHSFIAAGGNGVIQLFEDGTQHQLCHIPSQLADIAVAEKGRVILASSTDGALWQCQNNEPHVIGRDKPRATSMVALNDNVSIAIGYANGAASIYNTSSSSEVPLIELRGAVRDISTDPTGTHLALASDAELSVVELHKLGLDTTFKNRKDIRTKARRVEWLTDDLLVAISRDGGAWTFQPSSELSSFRQITNSDLTFLFVSRRSQRTLMADGEGHIIQLDLVRLSHFLCSGSGRDLPLL